MSWTFVSRDLPPLTSNTRAALAAEAVTFLLGTRWQDFDGVSFHAYVCEFAETIVAEGRPLLDGLAVPPLGSRADEYDPRILDLHEDLNHLCGMLIALVYERHEEHKAQLAPYFPADYPDDEPAPAGYLSRVCLDVARILYPFLRQVVVAYVDPVRRKAWGHGSPSKALATTASASCPRVFSKRPNYSKTRTISLRVLVLRPYSCLFRVPVLSRIASPKTLSFWTLALIWVTVSPVRMIFGTQKRFSALT